MALLKTVSDIKVFLPADVVKRWRCGSQQWSNQLEITFNRHGGWKNSSFSQL